MTGTTDSIDWNRALREHDRWLRSVAFARVRDSDAVDEVMQEVAVAAVSQAAPLEDPGKVAPWLYRLTLWQALQYRRRLGRRRNLARHYRQQAVGDGVSERDPLSWLLVEEQRRLVRRALQELRGRDAEVLMLKYLENWSYHEIAAHLGISHSAVEARLHRARRRLRERLAAHEDALPDAQARSHVQSGGAGKLAATGVSQDHAE